MSDFIDTAISKVSSKVSDVLFGGDRGLQGLIPDVVIDEGHDDSIVVTDHPVQVGASISDHAYVRPSTLKLRYGWSPGAPYVKGLLGSLLPVSTGLVSGIGEIFGGDDYLTGIYKKLLLLQRARKPITITTGKRIYKNMIIQSISFQTSKETEYSMIVNITCREVLIVNVKSTTVAVQKNMSQPQQTAAVQSEGTKVPTPAGEGTSLAQQGVNWLKGLFK